jgi:hypothetical protein
VAGTVSGWVTIRIQRLVEKGIIPVYIHDGGISTNKLNDWGLQRAFPWIKLPWFVQAKRPAYFDFIIPECHRTEVVQMCHVFNRDNKHKYGFSFKKI